MDVVFKIVVQGSRFVVGLYWLRGLCRWLLNDFLRLLFRPPKGFYRLGLVFVVSPNVMIEPYSPYTTVLSTLAGSPPNIFGGATG